MHRLMMHKALAITAISSFLTLVAADAVCAKGRRPGCNGPFPPGHRGVSHSWWAIGAESFQATILSVTVDLALPTPPKTQSGWVALVPSLENTVSLTHGHWYFPTVLLGKVLTGQQNISDWSGGVKNNQIYQIVAAAYPQTEL